MASDHRTLRFEEFSDALVEVERLAAGEVRTSGHYSFGQILEHLARTLDVMMGDMPAPKIPFYMRWLARMIRSRVLKKAQTGFQLPANAQSLFWPTEDVSVEEGLQHLRKSAEKFQTTMELPSHPFFGNMTREEHATLQCRHFEGHLGFVHPVE